MKDPGAMEPALARMMGWFLILSAILAGYFSFWRACDRLTSPAWPVTSAEIVRSSMYQARASRRTGASSWPIATLWRARPTEVRASASRALAMPAATATRPSRPGAWPAWRQVPASGCIPSGRPGRYRRLPCQLRYPRLCRRRPRARPVRAGGVGSTQARSRRLTRRSRADRDARLSADTCSQMERVWRSKP